MTSRPDIKTVIVEDEHLTAERIRTLLEDIDPGFRIMAVLDTVRASVRWFSENESPDLVFMDIQLADGLSFDIFDRVTLTCPVIFITAYQEYAIRAFRVNSVDYLLKPVTREGLQAAVDKYRQYFAGERTAPAMDMRLLENIRQLIGRSFKSRFMVRVGDRIRSLDVQEILYFYSFRKGTYVHTAGNRNYVIDYTLDALSDLLDPEQFHRINRSHIVSHAAITDLISLSAGRVKVVLQHAGSEHVYVSRDRLAGFKEWLDR